VLAVSAHFNAVSFWAQWEVTFEPNVSERAKLLVRLVEIATECVRLNAYSVAFALHSALISTSVHRLEQSKKAMAKEGSREVLAQQKELEKQLSFEHNYRAPLQLLEKCTPPCVPFLAIFLKQLVAVEEASADTLPPRAPGEQPLINFAKRRKLAEIIGRIQTYQSTRYALSPSMAVEQYCSPRIHRWEGALLDGALSGDTAYVRALESTLDRASQRVEPRQPRTVETPANTPRAAATPARRGSHDLAADAVTPRTAHTHRRGSVP